MFTKDEVVEALLEEADIDDFAFQHIISASQHMLGSGDDTSKAYLVLEALLDLGVVPVTSPYSVPPGQVWPEKDRSAIISRIDQEYRKIDRPLNFLDVCWFRKLK